MIALGAGSPSSTMPKRLRVLQVTPRLAPSVGGVETHVREVSRRLLEHGIETSILTVDDTGERLARDDLDGVPVERVRAWPRGRDYYFAPGLASRISRGEWDLVHVQSYHTLVAPIAMSAAWRAGVPYVATFHGGGSSSGLRNAARRPQMTLLRPLLRHAAALVAIADFEIERYGTWLGLPSDRFVKIPNGADLPPDTRLIVHEGTLIVSIGRLETYKGHHRVIAALPHVIDEIPDASLWIAGGGPAEEHLRAQAASLGIGDRVEIRATDRPTMAGRLRGASLAALLSDFESHPLAALEAASLDVPLVVAEDGAGLTELAQQGVARGVRLDATPAQHARAMIDEIRRPSRSAAPRIPTWDACTARLAELYRATTAAAVPPARQG